MLQYGNSVNHSQGMNTFTITVNYKQTYNGERSRIIMVLLFQNFIRYLQNCYVSDIKSGIKDVIPVIANESFHVYWLPGTVHDATRQEKYHAVWCLKDIHNLCMVRYIPLLIKDQQMKPCNNVLCINYFYSIYLLYLFIFWVSQGYVFIPLVYLIFSVYS